MSNRFSHKLLRFIAGTKSLRLAFLTVFIVLVGLVSVIGVLADNPGERFLFADQGFEDTNDPSPGWTQADGGPLSGWAVVSGGLNGSLYRMDGGWTSTINPSRIYAVRQWPTAVSSGVLTVTFTTRSHNETDRRGIAVAVGDSRTAIVDNTRNVYIRFANNSQIQYRIPNTPPGNWQDVITYTANTTYTIQFVINAGIKQADIWIDGNQEVSGLGYTESAAGPPKAVIFNRYSAVPCRRSHQYRQRAHQYGQRPI
jgi:hypothetical protein